MVDLSWLVIPLSLPFSTCPEPWREFRQDISPVLVVDVTAGSGPLKRLHASGTRSSVSNGVFVASCCNSIPGRKRLTLSSPRILLKRLRLWDEAGLSGRGEAISSE